jgi:diadenosine tetraphosphate (Ap4A) HIT family hydrolase
MQAADRCVFCRLIARELEASIVYEDRRTVVSGSWRGRARRWMLSTGRASTRDSKTTEPRGYASSTTQKQQGLDYAALLLAPEGSTLQE